MKVLILAAGFGVRLREVIHGRPKHLALISGQPFLHLLLKLLKKRGIKKIVFAVGYLAQYIIDKYSQDNLGLDISFSEDNRPLGTAGSLKKAQKYFKNDFIVINGDTYLDINYQKLLFFHQREKAILTVVGTTKNTQGSIIKTANFLVTDFITKPGKTVSGKYRHAGVYAVSPKLSSFIPKNTKYSIEKDLIPNLLKRKIPISFYSTDEPFIDIDGPKEYQKAITKFKKS